MRRGPDGGVAGPRRARLLARGRDAEVGHRHRARRLPMRTLSGLKSRCTSPAAWAAASPRPACTMTCSVSRHERGVSGEPPVERPSLDELHRQEDAVAERAHVVDGHHVGVREPRHRLRFAEEPPLPLGAERRRERRAEELDGDLPPELPVVRGVDEPHAALAEELQDHVPPDDESRRQRRVGDRGGRSGLEFHATTRVARGRARRYRRRRGAPAPS